MGSLLRIIQKAIMEKWGNDSKSSLRETGVSKGALCQPSTMWLYPESSNKFYFSHRVQIIFRFLIEIL